MASANDNEEVSQVDIDEIETSDSRECPEDHGLMTPIDLQYGYCPNQDGVIQAVVKWLVVDERVIVDCWAVSDDVAQQLLDVTAQPGQGEWIAQAEESGALRPYFDFSDVAQGHFRIDDSRPGYSQGYLVWDGSGEVLDNFRLVPDTVYHFFSSDPEDQPYGPQLHDVDQVLSLQGTENVLVITDLGTHDPSSQKTDAAVQRIWDFENRVTVWDWFQIQRGLERRQLAAD